MRRRWQLLLVILGPGEGWFNGISEAVAEKLPDLLSALRTPHYSSVLLVGQTAEKCLSLHQEDSQLNPQSEISCLSQASEIYFLYFFGGFFSPLNIKRNISTIKFQNQLFMSCISCIGGIYHEKTVSRRVSDV